MLEVNQLFDNHGKLHGKRAFQGSHEDKLRPVSYGIRWSHDDL